MSDDTISYVEAIARCEAGGLRTGRSEPMFHADLQAIAADVRGGRECGPLSESLVRLLQRIHRALRRCELRVDDPTLLEHLRYAAKEKARTLGEHLRYAARVAEVISSHNPPVPDPNVAAEMVRAMAEHE